jgi:hypothetical protein
MTQRQRHAVRQCVDLNRLRSMQSDQADAALAEAKARRTNAEALEKEAAARLDAIETEWRAQMAAAQINLQVTQMLQAASAKGEQRLNERNEETKRAKSEEAEAMRTRFAALGRQHAASALLKTQTRRLRAAQEEQRQFAVEDRISRSARQ